MYSIFHIEDINLEMFTSELKKLIKIKKKKYKIYVLYLHNIRRLFFLEKVCKSLLCAIFYQVISYKIF